jgi:hypothetical protein
MESSLEQSQKIHRTQSPPKLGDLGGAKPGGLTASLGAFAPPRPNFGEPSF